MTRHGAVPAVVFVGPTIDAAAVARLGPHVTVAPPAERGDVRAAVQAGYRVIGVVDGYFEHVPAVWHKEILMALAEGCLVLGGASMGALRAAELESYGMVGVGRIFDLVSGGVLSDADVAVAHGAGPAYEKFSEAHANVHFTLEAAVAAGCLDRSQGELLSEASRSIFYPERVYPEVMRVAVDQGLPREVAGRLADWLEGGAVDAKGEDAATLVELCERLSGSPPEPTAVRFSMSVTSQFVDMCHEEDLRRAGGAAAQHSRSVVEEALLDPRLGPDLWERARSRHLAHQYAVLSGVVPTQQLVDEASDDLRRTNGLGDETALMEWLDSNGMDLDAYTDLVGRSCLTRWSENRVGQRPGEAAVLDTLRLTGRFAEMAERAADKAAVLREMGHDGAAPRHEVDEADEEADLDWFFSEVWPGERPADVGHFARHRGFESRAALLRVIRRERIYRTRREAREARVRR
ncbi:MAG TPA: hypothetical protein ENI86_00705 [Acidimicrobiales bacterium]|nr:hypothetical protein [Acidimicrobiales bacterium]